MTRIIFITLFNGLLWLPFLQMATGFYKSPTVDENRNLAPKPNLDSWKDVDQYAKDAVKWFNDHYGLRDFLIRAKTQIDYSLFGMSTRVHIGKDGWLFYRSVIDVEQPSVEMMLKKDSDSVIEGTKALAKALNTRGIQLIVMIAPMKNVFYSDKLPSTSVPLPLSRQVNALDSRLKSIEEIIFIDSTEILRDAAKVRPVFHKTDFHWNDTAAFSVAENLVNKLGILEGKNSPTWNHKLEIELVESSGGEAMFLPIFFTPKEKSLMVKKNWIDPNNTYQEKIKPFEWIFELKNPNGMELKPIVVLGDSFFDGMVRSGMPIYFKKLSRASWNSVPLKQLLNELPADTRYLFLEFIEVAGVGYKSLAAEGQLK